LVRGEVAFLAFAGIDAEDGHGTGRRQEQVFEVFVENTDRLTVCALLELGPDFGIYQRAQSAAVTVASRNLENRRKFGFLVADDEIYDLLDRPGALALDR
jgi:hypothetical protein